MLTVKLTNRKYVTALYTCDGASPYGIARTLDNGQTWESCIPPTTANACLRLRFTDPRTGLAACGAGGLWRTADGALTWSQVIDATVNSVDMADASIGWACGVTGGASTIWKTADGGLTWTPTTITGIGATALYEVKALTTLIAWVTGAAYSGNWVRRYTSDGGATWAAPSTTVYNMNHTTNCIAAGPVVGDDIGHYVVTARADEADLIVSFSVDHGVTFSMTVGPPVPGGKRLVHTSGARFLLVRQNGDVFGTRDGGIRWGYASSVSGTEMTHEPGLVQFVIGSGFLYRTSDGGLTWKKGVQPFATGGPLAQCSGYLQTGPALVLPVWPGHGPKPKMPYAMNVLTNHDEHGPLSMSMDVVVKDAFAPYPHGLELASWAEVWDGAHLLWDGEISTITPRVV